MTLPHLPFEIPESERTPLVNWLLELIVQQQEVIENQRLTIARLEEKVNQLEEKVGSLDEQLIAAKNIVGVQLAKRKIGQPCFGLSVGFMGDLC